MAGLKEIKRRLKSVKNTKKITYAMKLVSAAKLQKIQEKVGASQRYLDILTDIFSQVVEAFGDKELNFDLLKEHEKVQKIALIIVGGSRGLCGGYNTNLNKKIIETFSELTEKYKDAKIETYVFGKKVNDFFKRLNKMPTHFFTDLDDNIFSWPLDELLMDLKKQYVENKVDRVYVLYTKFHSALSVTPCVGELLPLKRQDVVKKKKVDPALVVYEPEKEKLLEELLPKFLKIRMLQAVLDASASENGCRMTAMDSATNNANDLMAKLQLNYNKLRQSAITSELLDIIGGAEAIS